LSLGLSLDLLLLLLSLLLQISGIRQNYCSVFWGQPQLLDLDNPIAGPGAYSFIDGFCLVFAVDSEGMALLFNPIGLPLNTAVVVFSTTLNVQNHLNGKVEVLALPDVSEPLLYGRSLHGFC
jgi:hypothetical protein